LILVRSETLGLFHPEASGHVPAFLPNLFIPIAIGIKRIFPPVRAKGNL